MPYASWCPHCVRGRAPDPPHRRSQASEQDRDEVIIQVDYCFPKVRAQDTMLTTLVAVDDAFGSCAVIPTEKKGSTDKIAVLALRAFVASVAQPKMVLQCDLENAIKDVVHKVFAT